MKSNGDTYREFKVGTEKVRGLGSFHKTLTHNNFGEVDQVQFERLVEATEGVSPFATVPRNSDAAARLSKLTIEGELNKLASNVAMGRGMGGVHWRTDNTRSLMLGQAIAAHILADITTDLHERPRFEFRSFNRKSDGEPKLITIQQGQIRVDGVLVSSATSEL